MPTYLLFYLIIFVLASSGSAQRKKLLELLKGTALAKNNDDDKGACWWDDEHEAATEEDGDEEGVAVNDASRLKGPDLKFRNKHQLLGSPFVDASIDLVRIQFYWLQVQVQVRAG